MQYKFHYSIIYFFIIAFFSSCAYNKAPEPKIVNQKISYSLDIRPIIAHNCYVCHSDTATDPDRRIPNIFWNDFDTLQAYALRPSSIDGYTKIQARIRGLESPQMPYKRAPLSEEDIQKIEDWIHLGAPNN